MGHIAEKLIVHARVSHKPQHQQGGGPGVYVVYQDRAISYNEQDKRLYRLEQPFTGPGEVTIVFDENSFIFVSR